MVVLLGCYVYFVWLRAFSTPAYPLAHAHAWRAGASPTLHVGLMGYRAFSTSEGTYGKDTTDCCVGQGFLKK